MQHGLCSPGRPRYELWLISLAGQVTWGLRPWFYSSVKEVEVLISAISVRQQCLTVSTLEQGPLPFSLQSDDENV